MSVEASAAVSIGRSRESAVGLASCTQRSFSSCRKAQRSGAQRGGGAVIAVLLSAQRPCRLGAGSIAERKIPWLHARVDSTGSVAPSSVKPRQRLDGGSETVVQAATYLAVCLPISHFDRLIHDPEVEGNYENNRE